MALKSVFQPIDEENDQLTAPPVFASVTQPLQPTQGASVQPQAPSTPNVFAATPKTPQVFAPLDELERPKQERLQKLQHEDANPFGSANNHPGVFGKIAHGLALAGNIAGNVFAPAVMANIPGTDLHRQREENELTSDIGGIENQKSEQAQRAATTEHEQAETEKLKQPAPHKYAPLQTDQGLNSFDEATGQTAPLTGANGQPLTPPAKTPTNEFELWHQQNPNGTPEQFNQLMSKPLSKDQADSLNQTWARVAQQYHLPANQFREGMSTADATELSKALNDAISKAQGGQKIVIQGERANQAGSTSRDRDTEREYTSLYTGWNKQAQSAQSQLEKTQEAQQLIGSGAMGQAIGAIKTLSSLASGQGSGVRITQAELNSLLHARGIQGDWDGFVNKISGQGALSGQQVQQINEILSAVGQRAQQKIQMLNEGLDQMQGATNKEDLRKIDSNLRHSLLGDGGKYSVDQVVQGYRFKGGDWKDKANWEKAQ